MSTTEGRSASAENGTPIGKEALRPPGGDPPAQKTGLRCWRDVPAWLNQFHPGKLLRREGMDDYLLQPHPSRLMLVNWTPPVSMTRQSMRLCVVKKRLRHD